MTISRFHPSLTGKLARLCAGIAIVLFPMLAKASGDYEPEDNFVARYGTDLDPDKYEAGELGVILPSYPRLYLYPAWRAIVLGHDGLQKYPATPDGLRKAQIANHRSGWFVFDSGDQPSSVMVWNKASAPYAGPNRKAADQGERRIPDEYSSYVVCLSPAFSFATDTLNALTRRSDATPARLHDWVSAQDDVFAFCSYDPSENQGPNHAPVVALQIPSPLPASEPLYWRQLRQYQIAAANFYNENLAESAKQFAAIGADKSHPMRAWGAYLAIRANARSAYLGTSSDSAQVATRDAIQKVRKEAKDNPKADQEQYALGKQLEQQGQAWNAKKMAEIVAQAKAILADPSLSQIHDATRAALRTAQARLEPVKRFEELGGILDDVKQNPHQEDHLNDWALLSNDPQVSASLKEDAGDHPFLDWMLALQNCGLSGDEMPRGRDSSEDTSSACDDEYKYALSQWTDSVENKEKGDAHIERAWLVAALMLADTIPENLEHAALEVSPDAPEYLTVRYNLARLYRRAAAKSNDGDAKSGADLMKQAKAISDDLLNSGRLQKLSGPGAENLFKQERFAVSESLPEAVGYLLRKSTGRWDDEFTKDIKHDPANTESTLADDGIRWIDSQLTVKEILAVAKDERLNKQIRSEIAVSAWIRADLLHKNEAANEAALLVAATIPSLKPDASHYAALTDDAEKRHAIILTMLRFNLQALLTSYWQKPNFDKAVPADARASMWCHFENDDLSSGNFTAEQIPPAPKTGTSSSELADEMMALKAVKTATGFVGDHVMQWVIQHPDDADNPWLLHVVVGSTRGGCLDGDASRLSKAAYTLLHSRYKNSEWAKKTPYWY